MDPIDLIPIFQGKKREYNTLILEALATEGPLKNWSLAKKIYELSSKDRDVHNIYSVIVRKNGRLEELHKKKYIGEIEDKWGATEKGILGLLIVKPNLYNKIYPDYFSQSMFSGLPTSFSFSVNIKGKSAKKNIDKSDINFTKFYKYYYSPQGYLDRSKTLKELIVEGINLDMINMETLSQFLAIRSKDKIMNFVESEESKKYINKGFKILQQ